MRGVSTTAVPLLTVPAEMPNKAVLNMPPCPLEAELQSGPFTKGTRLSREDFLT